MAIRSDQQAHSARPFAAALVAMVAVLLALTTAGPADDPIRPSASLALSGDLTPSTSLQAAVLDGRDGLRLPGPGSVLLLSGLVAIVVAAWATITLDSTKSDVGLDRPGTQRRRGPPRRV